MVISQLPYAGGGRLKNELLGTPYRLAIAQCVILCYEVLTFFVTTCLYHFEWSDDMTQLEGMR